MASMQLLMEILAVDLASEKIREVGKEIEGSGIGAQAATLAMGALAAGVALAGSALADSVGEAAKFETSFTKIAALTDSTAADLDTYKKGIEEVGHTTGKSAVELSDAMFIISSAGLKGSDAVEALAASAKGSAVGLGETKVVADAVTSALNAYGLAGDQAAHMTDVLAEAVVQGKASADSFAPAMGRILPIAAAVGVTFDQVAGTMAAMTRVGINTDEAATALRSTLAAFEKPGKEAVDTLHSIGLSVEEVRTELREKGTLAVLQDLQDRTGGNVDELAKIIPNIRGLTGVLALAADGGKAYAGIMDGMADSSGKVDRAMDLTNQTFAQQTKVFNERLESVKIEVGESLLPALTPLLMWLSEELPLAVDAAREALGHIHDAMLEVQSHWTEDWGGIRTTLETVTGAMGPIVEAQMGIIGTIVQLHMDALHGVWTGDWTAMQTDLSTAWQTMQTTAEGALTALEGGITNLLNWLIDTALPTIVFDLVSWGKAFVDWVSKDVLPNLPGALDGIGAAISSWVEGGGIQLVTAEAAHLGSAFISGIGSAIENGAGGLKDAASRAVNNALGAARAALGNPSSPSPVTYEQLGKPFIQGVEQAIIDGASGVNDALTGLVNVSVAQLKRLNDQVTREFADKMHMTFEQATDWLQQYGQASGQLFTVQIPQQLVAAADALNGYDQQVEQYAARMHETWDTARTVLASYGDRVQEVLGDVAPTKVQQYDSIVEAFAAKHDMTWEQARNWLDQYGAASGQILGDQVPANVSTTTTALNTATAASGALAASLEAIPTDITTHINQVYSSSGGGGGGGSGSRGGGGGSTSYGGKTYDLSTDAGRNQLISDAANNLIAAGPGGSNIARLLEQAGSARAGGGPVTAGQPYLVGEAGAEMFIPGASGSIVPRTATIDYDRLAEALARAIGNLTVAVDGRTLGQVTRADTSRMNGLNTGAVPAVGGL